MLIWLERGSCHESMVPTHKLLLRVFASTDAHKNNHCHNPGHYEISSTDVTHSNVFPLALIFRDRLIKQMNFKLCGNTTSSPTDHSLKALMEALISFHSQDPTIASIDGPGNEGMIQGLLLSLSFHNDPHTLLLESTWKQTKSTVSCISSKSIFYLIIILLATVF